MCDPVITGGIRTRGFQKGVQGWTVQMLVGRLLEALVGSDQGTWETLGGSRGWEALSQVEV